MCMMKSPAAAPPPPPPPEAPPVLEQDAPSLSDANEDGRKLDKRAAGFKSYKIDKRNKYMSDGNKLGNIDTSGKTSVNI